MRVRRRTLALRNLPPLRFSTNTLEELVVIKNLTIGSIIAGLCSASLYAQPSIEQLAPPDSVVIVSVSNVAASVDRLQQTKLWELWKTPQVEQLRTDLVKQMTEHIDEMLQQLGVEKDTLVVPQGSVGFALYPLTPQDMEEPSSGMLLVADYGENADKTGQLIEAAIAQRRIARVFLISRPEWRLPRRGTDRLLEVQPHAAVVQIVVGLEDDTLVG